MMNLVFIYNNGMHSIYNKDTVLDNLKPVNKTMTNMKIN